MSTRKVAFVPGEYFHVFNRGVDKRFLFQEEADVNRFLASILSFNTTEPIGSIYEASFQKEKQKNKKKLVDIIVYCLNPNHFHLLLTPKVERGVERFMQRVGTGYTMYFNNKYKRSGSLFQGKFKAVHVSNNAQLLHVSAYIILNDQKHQLGGKASKLVRSSWKEYQEYTKGVQGFCEKNILLDQFKNAREYCAFAVETMRDMIRKKHQEETESVLLE